MAAIGAGIGDDTDLDGGQRPIALGAELDLGRHLVARSGAGELLLAGVLPHHRAAELDGGQQAEVLGDHFLLAAEAAADPLGEDVQVAGGDAHHVGELLLDGEGTLAAGPDMPAAVVALPGDRAMRLEVHVLHGELALQAHVVGTHERAHVKAFRQVLGSAAIGRPRFDFIVQFVQTAREDLDALGGIPFRGGTTVITEVDGKVRYVIPRPLGSRPAAKERLEKQKAFTRACALHDPLFN